jgi:hypothetical protein
MLDLPDRFYHTLTNNALLVKMAAHPFGMGKASDRNRYRAPL